MSHALGKPSASWISAWHGESPPLLEEDSFEDTRFGEERLKREVLLKRSFEWSPALTATFWESEGTANHPVQKCSPWSRSRRSFCEQHPELPISTSSRWGNRIRRCASLPLVSIFSGFEVCEGGKTVISSRIWGGEEIVKHDWGNTRFQDEFLHEPWWWWYKRKTFLFHGAQ